TFAGIEPLTSVACSAGCGLGFGGAAGFASDSRATRAAESAAAESDNSARVESRGVATGGPAGGNAETLPPALCDMKPPRLSCDVSTDGMVGTTVEPPTDT